MFNKLYQNNPGGKQKEVNRKEKGDRKTFC